MPRPSSTPKRTAVVVPPRSLPPVGVVAPSFGQIVKESFGTGIGVSLGARAVNAVLGPPKVEVLSQPQQPQSTHCKDLPVLRERYTECMKDFGATHKCEEEFEAFNSCIRNSQ